MANPETCRDVLRDMLAIASNISDFDDALDLHGFSTDRIRAAMAVDDAELARLRRIEGAAQVVTDLPGVLLAVTIDIARASGIWRGVPWSIYAEHDTRHDHVRGQVSVGQDTVADVAVYANGADSLWAEAQDVLAAILWSALRARAMRQFDAALANSHPDGCHSTDRDYVLTGGCGGDGHFTCKTCTQYDPDEHIVWAKDSDADTERDDG